MRDLYNMANHLSQNAAKFGIVISRILVLTNKYLGEKNIARFPKECVFEIIYDIRKQIRTYLKQMYSTSLETIRSTMDIVAPEDNRLVSLVHISGHGYQTRDVSGDEVDGCDEYIRVNCATLLDDELHSLFILPGSGEIKGFDFKFVGMVDTCHSGTMFDLDYTLQVKNGVGSWIYAKRGAASMINKDGATNDGATDGAFSAVSIGACTDAQLDNCDVGEEVGFGGSLTIHLIENSLVFPMIVGGEADYVRVYNVLRPVFAKLRQEPVIQRSSTK